MSLSPSWSWASAWTPPGRQKAERLASLFIDRLLQGLDDAGHVRLVERAVAEGRGNLLLAGHHRGDVTVDVHVPSLRAALFSGEARQGGVGVIGRDLRQVLLGLVRLVGEPDGDEVRVGDVLLQFLVEFAE